MVYIVVDELSLQYLFAGRWLIMKYVIDIQAYTRGAILPRAANEWG